MSAREDAIAERDWWKAAAPSDWTLIGWNRRMKATFCAPNSSIPIVLDARIVQHHAAAAQAERAASYAAVQRQIGTGNKGDFPVWNAAVEACLAAILARGDTSALDGLLAEEFHKGWRKGQDDALESAKPEIEATASALAAAVEAARREEREACVGAVERERLELPPDNDVDEAYNAAIQHASAAIRARSGGKEGA